MNYKHLAAAALCALSALALPAHARSAALQSITTLDVPRYMGVWYEIARYPNRFQKMCVGSTRAEYALQTDGTVRVTNRCATEGGGVSEAVGQARQTGSATSAQLEVRFAPAWLSFLPLVWGNYWVIDLDSDYQLAAVSEPNREYLWILSRTPTVPADAWQRLSERLQQNGFDLGKLEMTRQP